VIVCGESAAIMAGMPGNMVDLTVTSPPYDNLRNYNEFEFDWRAVIAELYRITKPGGVVVWVVGDATIQGSETGTSFRQALYAMECGFLLWDTMIYQKIGNGAPQRRPYIRYSSAFEYMFVWAKGKPKTFNPIMVYGEEKCVRYKSKRNRDGHIVGRLYNAGSGAPAPNVWQVKPDHMTAGKNTYYSSQHPAPFPERLAHDHIISWSNAGDLVFDPFCGSGTTLAVARQLRRRYLGTDISEEYCQIAKQRVNNVQYKLFSEVVL